jgi:hypothetical protein
MEVYIFLSQVNFDCLFKVVPEGSKSRHTLDENVRLEHRGFSPVVGSIAIKCDEEESRDLLYHAQIHCKPAVESIRLAMRSAGITV